VRRAERYRAAGCDCLFVPALVDGREIETVAAAIDPMPLNIMLMPGLPSVAVLRKQGVRRLSAGSAIAQVALAFTGRLAADFLAGSSDEMFVAAADYSTTNRLFSSD
jgi:2-methylisocitrate lyase-like PEP mutase family enzyme